MTKLLEEAKILLQKGLPEKHPNELGNDIESNLTHGLTTHEQVVLAGHHQKVSENHTFHGTHASEQGDEKLSKLHHLLSSNHANAAHFYRIGDVWEARNHVGFAHSNTKKLRKLQGHRV